MAYDDSYVPKEVSAALDLMDTYFRNKNFEQKDDRQYEHYHPSEWGKCLRMQQYKHYAWKGWIPVKKKGISTKSFRVFDNGHSMHFRWKAYFDDIGGILLGQWKCKNLLCYTFNEDGKVDSSISPDSCEKFYQKNKTRIYGEEIPVFRPEKCVCGCTDFEYLEPLVKDENLNIEGHADLLLNCDSLTEDRFSGVTITYNKDFLPVKGQKVVADLKSIGSKSWKNQLIDKKGPYKEHLVQLTIYIHILNCDYGILMYENKDTQELLWYKVEKNDKWWEVIKEQANQMIQMASIPEKKKLPPPRCSSKTDYMCMDCDFKSLCHASDIWKDPVKLKERIKKFYKCLL